MSKGQIVAAIDIGTSKITTIIANKSFETEKINVIGIATHSSLGLRKSQIIDIEEAVEAITESVEAAERMAGCSLSKAFISLGGVHINSINSKGVVAIAEPEGEITAEDVERVIEAARAVSLPAAREALHVIPRDFIVDSQEGIKDPLGMTGVRLEVETHIITGSSTAMKNIIKCVEELGIEVDSLVFTGLAVAESILTDTEKELGVCLVDIGGGTTSIAVFMEGSLAYSAVLPVGAKNITNDLAIGLRVSLDSAEKIKIALSGEEKVKEKEARKESEEIDFRKLGIKEDIGKTSRKTLVEGIIRPLLNEIFQMVGDELKKSGYGGSTPAGIVLSGGGAQTVGIAQSCKRTLSLPVRIGYPNGLSGLVEDIKTPDFATCQGLILYALKQKQTIEPRFSLPHLSKFKFKGKMSIGGFGKKIIDFIKSFLP